MKRLITFLLLVSFSFGGCTRDIDPEISFTDNGLSFNMHASHSAIYGEILNSNKELPNVIKGIMTVDDMKESGLLSPEHVKDYVLSYMIDKANSAGMDLSLYMFSYNYNFSNNFFYASSLEPGELYYIYAFAVDDSGERSTDITILPTYTLKEDQNIESDSFFVNVDNITYYDFEISIMPTDMHMKYCVELIETKILEEKYGDDLNSFASDMLDVRFISARSNYWLDDHNNGDGYFLGDIYSVPSYVYKRGPVLYDRDYSLIVFGISDQGARKTRVFRTDFRTTEPVSTNIYHVDVVDVQRDMVTVGLTVEGSTRETYVAEILPYASIVGLDDATIEDMAFAAGNSYYSNDDGMRHYRNLEPQTEYAVVVFGYHLASEYIFVDGKANHIYHKVATTKPSITRFTTLE